MSGAKRRRSRRHSQPQRRPIRSLLGVLGAALIVFGGQVPLSADQIQTEQPVPPPAVQARPELEHQASRQLLSLARQHGLAQMPAEALQVRVIKAEVMASADRLGVPRALALAVSGHESGGWKMWEQNVVSNANRADSGNLLSTDWGVMQINDKAHPHAFPRASQDLAYNVEYGLNYLAELHQVYQGNLNQGFGDWDATLAAYNLGHTPTVDEMPTARRYLGRLRTFLKSERLPFRLSYTVQPGDTLASIAEQKLGRASRWQDIMQINSALLTSPQSLRAGQQLEIPLI